MDPLFFVYIHSYGCPLDILIYLYDKIYMETIRCV